MNSPLFPPEPELVPGMVRLPAHCSTVTAEDLRVRLVLAGDADGAMTIDASEVQSVGQAVIQLLLASAAEAARNGQAFSIADPSPAFVERLSGCRLGDALGLSFQQGDLS